jgi:hypothetical protein
MRYGGPRSNDGRIPYSVREMADNPHVSIPTARLRVFSELQKHGFIVEIRRGRYGRKRTYASEWRLTEFACDLTADPPTHAYRQWRGETPQQIATRDFARRARSVGGRRVTIQKQNQVCNVVSLAVCNVVTGKCATSFHLSPKIQSVVCNVVSRSGRPTESRLHTSMCLPGVCAFDRASGVILMTMKHSLRARDLKPGWPF